MSEHRPMTDAELQEWSERVKHEFPGNSELARYIDHVVAENRRLRELAEKHLRAWFSEYETGSKKRYKELAQHLSSIHGRKFTLQQARKRINKQDGKK